MTSMDYSVKNLENVLETDGQVKSTEVTRLVPPGENHSSLVLKADFQVEKDGHVKTISTVVKCVPMNCEDFILKRALTSQKNEIIFYKEMVPLMLNFAKDYGIFDEANFYPEFYGSRYSLDKLKTEPDADTVILLENLMVEGYHVVDRYIGFDLESSKTVLKRLAAFHAIPVAMKFKKPEAFKILADCFVSAKGLHQGPPPNQKKGPRGPELLWTALQNIPECAPYISRLEPLFNRPMMGPPRTEVKEPWATISHNDFWGNNIMIKQNKNKEAPVIILDHARYSYDSFAKDLLFFLLTSVQNDVLAEFLDDLLRVYYEEFTRLLKCCEVSPILSFDEYIEEVNLIAKQSETGKALGFSAIIFGPKNPAVDHLVGEGNLFDHIFESSKDINQYRKNKLISIVSVAAKREWI